MDEAKRLLAPRQPTLVPARVPHEQGTERDATPNVRWLVSPPDLFLSGLTSGRGQVGSTRSRARGMTTAAAWSAVATRTTG